MPKLFVYTEPTDESNDTTYLIVSTSLLGAVVELTSACVDVSSIREIPKTDVWIDMGLFEEGD